MTEAAAGLKPRFHGPQERWGPPVVEPWGPERDWGLGNRLPGEPAPLVDPADVKLEPRRPVDDAELLQQRPQPVKASRAEPGAEPLADFGPRLSSSGGVTPPLGPDGTPGDPPILSTGSGGVEPASDEAPRPRKRLLFGDGRRLRAMAAPGGEGPEQDEAPGPEAPGPEEGAPSPAPKIEANLPRKQESRPASIPPSRSSMHKPSSSAERDPWGASREESRAASAPPDAPSSRKPAEDGRAPAGEGVAGPQDAGGAIPPTAGGASAALPRAPSQVEKLALKVEKVEKDIAGFESTVSDLESAFSPARRAADKAQADCAEAEDEDIPDPELSPPGSPRGATVEEPLPEPLPESSDSEAVEVRSSSALSPGQLQLAIFFPTRASCIWLWIFSML